MFAILDNCQNTWVAVKLRAAAMPCRLIWRLSVEQHCAECANLNIAAFPPCGPAREIMCGLAGFVGPGDKTDVIEMTQRLVHRGPDAGGFFVDQGTRTFLGHRRLSIVDLDDGAQPMSDGSLTVVFNGEIYNHIELRRELEARGHRFKTDHSDTEVLIFGYREWGEGLLSRLNGMFAFAMLDLEQRKVFLGRDRFGEKPIYYYHRDGLFAFASELTALTEHSRIDREIDQKSLQKLFAYGYIPSPHAFYRHCRKLPAGTWLSYDIGRDCLASGEYWRFSLSSDDSFRRRTDDNVAEELWSLLQASATRRLMSDVPIGIFLSGGLDSSAVLLAAASTARDLSTFTVGFTEPSYDESGYALQVASAVGTRHHKEQLDLEAARELIPGVLGSLDEPLGDASIIPTYLLSKYTRGHVTVALSGDGGDEMFAGYDPFAALAPAKYYSRHVPPFLNGLLRRGADVLPHSPRNMSWDFKIRRALMGLSYPEEMWNPVWMAPVEPAEMGTIFDEPLPAEELYEEAIVCWQRCNSSDPVDRTLEFFTHLYLQNDILTKVDRASMMVSLESRAVFLDNDLAEFCARLPNSFKFRNGQRKFILKHALRDRLPPTILDRKKKGFGIPLPTWLREMSAALPLAPVPGMRADAMKVANADHARGYKDHRFQLWTWWSVQAVLERDRGSVARAHLA